MASFPTPFLQNGQELRGHHAIVGVDGREEKGTLSRTWHEAAALGSHPIHEMLDRRRLVDFGPGHLHGPIENASRSNSRVGPTLHPYQFMNARQEPVVPSPLWADSTRGVRWRFRKARRDSRDVKTRVPPEARGDPWSAARRPRASGIMTGSPGSGSRRRTSRCPTPPASRSASRRCWPAAPSHCRSTAAAGDRTATQSWRLCSRPCPRSPPPAPPSPSSRPRWHARRARPRSRSRCRSSSCATSATTWPRPTAWPSRCRRPARDLCQVRHRSGEG